LLVGEAHCRSLHYASLRSEVVTFLVHCSE
jgi:hypothetical protein